MDLYHVRDSFSLVFLLSDVLIFPVKPCISSRSEAVVKLSIHVWTLEESLLRRYSVVNLINKLLFGVL